MPHALRHHSPESRSRFHGGTSPARSGSNRRAHGAPAGPTLLGPGGSPSQTQHGRYPGETPAVTDHVEQ